MTDFDFSSSSYFFFLSSSFSFFDHLILVHLTSFLLPLALALPAEWICQQWRQLASILHSQTHLGTKMWEEHTAVQILILRTNQRLRYRSAFNIFTIPETVVCYILVDQEYLSQLNSCPLVKLFWIIYFFPLFSSFILSDLCAYQSTCFSCFLTSSSIIEFLSWVSFHEWNSIMEDEVRK